MEKTYQTYTIQVHTYKREDTTLSLFGYHVLEKKKHSHHHPNNTCYVFIFILIYILYFCLVKLI